MFNIENKLYSIMTRIKDAPVHNDYDNTDDDIYSGEKTTDDELKQLVEDYARDMKGLENGKRWKLSYGTNVKLHANLGKLLAAYKHHKSIYSLISCTCIIQFLFNEGFGFLKSL